MIMYILMDQKCTFVLYSKILAIKENIHVAYMNNASHLCTHVTTEYIQIWENTNIHVESIQDYMFYIHNSSVTG